METMRAASSPPNFGLQTPPPSPCQLRRPPLPCFNGYDLKLAKLRRSTRGRAVWISDENQVGKHVSEQHRQRIKSDVHCTYTTQPRSFQINAELFQLDGQSDDLPVQGQDAAQSQAVLRPHSPQSACLDEEIQDDLPRIFRARRNADREVVFTSIETDDGISEDAGFTVTDDGHSVLQDSSLLCHSRALPASGSCTTTSGLNGGYPAGHYAGDVLPLPVSDALSSARSPLPPDTSLPTPPCTPSPKRRQSPVRAGYEDQTPDLTLPNLPVFPTPPPGNALLDTPTPLTRAHPAIGAFPFPAHGTRESSLSPLAVRRLRPSQAVRRPSSSSGATNPSSRADRFISQRNSRVSSAEAFRTSKPVHKLTPREKLLRGQSAGPDPFRSPLRSNGTIGGSAINPLTDPNPSLETRSPSRPIRLGSTVLAIQPNAVNQPARQASHGAVWHVGGPSPIPRGVAGISDGRGGMLGRGTSAPLYTASFLLRNDPIMQAEAQERRTALAIGVDPSARILPSSRHENSPTTSSPTFSGSSPDYRGINEHSGAEFMWRDNAWMMQGDTRVLDAESLRDDYYCSILAYSPTADCLAVGLANLVYLWTESHGVCPCPSFINNPRSAHVTSLSFSSHSGGQAILAIGRADGRLALWSPKDKPHFLLHQPCPVACLSFRPNVTQRCSEQDAASLVAEEDLLVGDEAGVVYYFSVQWPTSNHQTTTGWAGSVSLLARIQTHTQQICGLAWSPDGEYFATGGNDNCAFLFETRKIVPNLTDATMSPRLELRIDPETGTQHLTPTVSPRSAIAITLSAATHCFSVSAAVKALAFCPWQRGLLALGGGSNDRAVHFYHTVSGAALATIDVAAQVTSLVWSTTRREICATFGFSSFPEHAVRVAVFSWPSCDCVVSIPWSDEGRALWGISYPGGPDVGGRSRGTGARGSGRGTNGAVTNAAQQPGDTGPRRQGLSERESEGHGRAARDRGSREGASWWTRTRAEGCIVVATSEGSIKFHEVWADRRTGGRTSRRRSGAVQGLLGGSDILESLHGIEKEGPEVIR